MNIIPGMSALTLLRFSLICLCLCAMSCLVCAQTPPSGSSSIRGSAMIGDQPLPGLKINLQRPRTIGIVAAIASAETDGEGKYQFNNLPAGEYSVQPVSSHLISTKEEPFGVVTRAIAVAEGETVENINFSLQRGGIVTGKVTDANGYPVIGQRVGIERFDPQGNVMPANMRFYAEAGQTDDRGIYRLFGLHAGRYRLYVDDRSRLTSASAFAPRTFYPSAQDTARAELVEVSAGGEMTGIDIKLSAANQSLYVAGRVIDAQTGAPLPNVQVGYATDRSSMSGGVLTNERGEFRYEGFPPDRYSFFASMRGESEFYSDLTAVELKETSVDGVVVKAHRGATISGWVTFEGKPEPKVLAQIPELRIYPILQSKERRPPTNITQSIGANGSISFKGLQPGKYWFGVLLGNIPQGFSVVRVEYQGAAQEGGVEVVPGKNLTDVRLVISAGTGGIRGRIQKNDESIELPEPGFIQVSVMPVRKNPLSMGGSTRVDRRGNFAIEGLAPGEYEVRAMLRFDAPPTRRNVILRGNSKVIVVKQGENIEVVLPVELFN
jgi:protocatechuate 3,4-dioxygenase beta subunit